MEFSIDKKLYFRRIGFTGDVSSSLETLRQIHFLHPQAIPFENLNPLLRLPVALDLPSLERKILKNRRGGYCFEHNLVLKHILEGIGFKVKGLGARVMWNLPEDVVTARGHMLLLIELEEKQYIADVGFGGLTLTSPLSLVTDVEQQTPHEVFRLIKPEEDFILQAFVKSEWKSIYRFNLQQQFLPDYEVSSWYLSNHPTSHFITSLIVARTTPECRFVLRNNQLSIHNVNGDTEKRIIKQVDELKTVLADTFLIDVPEVSHVDETLQALLVGFEKL